jgi:hypothetical protein
MSYARLASYHTTTANKTLIPHQPASHRSLSKTREGGRLTSTVWMPFKPMGNRVCRLNHPISDQFNFGSMNPPTERPIPPPLLSDWILPPEIPEAYPSNKRKTRHDRM